MATARQMPLVDSLKALYDIRSDEVVITAMGTAREWMTFGTHPLDWVFVPSSMGQATSLGLGMALARPEKKVIVCNGDGSTLMNLGSLVSITAHAPQNLVVLIFDNNVYEITGAQSTPGTPATRADGRPVDFCAIARGCGFQTVHEFDDLEQWRAQIRRLIDEPGPTFALLHVAPVPGAVGPKSPGPAPRRAQDFMAALNRE